MFFQNQKSFELDYLVQRLAAQQFFGVTGSWFHPFVGRIGEDDAEFFGWREAAQEIEYVLLAHVSLELRLGEIFFDGGRFPQKDRESVRQ